MPQRLRRGTRLRGGWSVEMSGLLLSANGNDRLQNLIEQLSSASDQVSAYSLHNALFVELLFPLRSADIATGQFPTHGRAVAIFESGDKLAACRIAALLGLVIPRLCSWVPQTDGHERSGHDATGLRGSGHSAAKRSADLQSSFSVQPEPGCIGREDGLRSAEAGLETCDGIFYPRIFHCHSPYLCVNAICDIAQLVRQFHGYFIIPLNAWVPQHLRWV